MATSWFDKKNYHSDVRRASLNVGYKKVYYLQDVCLPMCSSAMVMTQLKYFIHLGGFLLLEETE